MRRLFLFTLVLLILLTGCSSTPVKDIEVEAQADPKANFSGYKTYAWLGSAAILDDPSGQWKPPGFDADMEIKFLIDHELRQRGMSEAYSNPDVIVGFAAALDMDALDVKVDPESKLETLVNTPQGGIIVVLVDSQTRYVIWVGAATAEVQNRPDTETAKARLNYAITQMFEKLPADYDQWGRPN